MRVSHHRIMRKTMKAAAKAERGKHEAWFATDPNRKRTSSYQNGGLGTMLAISSSSRGGGTNYHYDEVDDGEVLLSDAHTQTDD
jgi:hypothetical protein